MSFTAEIWERAAPIRAAIDDLAFNRELAAGTLSKEVFREYMIQDALYLQGYARALAIAAARAPDADEIMEFADAAKVAIIVERALHAGFFEKFGVDPREAERAEPSPTCAGYVNFIIATAATGSYGELVAAILPCFWIYRDVGLRISNEAGADNFYQDWINTYSDENFGEATERQKAIVNRAAARAGSEERAKMGEAFLRCAQYEWMFWDAAYRCEDWPVRAAAWESA